MNDLETVVMPIAYPLDDFYAQARRALPPIQQVAPENIPDPYRSLLVHEADMTPTLEGFYADHIHLRVINSQERDGAYYREVVLLLNKTNARVEFGAIKINLNLFPVAARKAILDEDLPLGRVLADFRIKHSSRPKAFLKIESDEFIGDALGEKPGELLYGRRNTLFDPRRQPLAEIVEILPKIAKP